MLHPVADTLTRLPPPHALPVDNHSYTYEVQAPVGTAEWSPSSRQRRVPRRKKSPYLLLLVGLQVLDAVAGGDADESGQVATAYRIGLESWSHDIYDLPTRAERMNYGDFMRIAGTQRTILGTGSLFLPRGIMYVVDNRQANRR